MYCVWSLFIGALNLTAPHGSVVVGSHPEVAIFTAAGLNSAGLIWLLTNGALSVSWTDQFPPGTYTLSGVITEATETGLVPIENAEVWRLDEESMDESAFPVSPANSPIAPTTPPRCVREKTRA